MGLNIRTATLNVLASIGLHNRCVSMTAKLKTQSYPHCSQRGLTKKGSVNDEYSNLSRLNTREK